MSVAQKNHASAREAVMAEFRATEDAHKAAALKLESLRVKLNKTAPFLATLTHDIITEIFFILVQEEGSQITPWNLGRVCKAWRDHVWSNSKLWRRLEMRLTHINAKVKGELLSQWMDLSGNQPLEICLYEEGTLDDDSPMKEIYHILLTAAGRWKTLDLAAGPFSSLRDELAVAEYQFPLLLSISLGDTSAGREAEEWFFGYPPRIKRFEVSREFIPDSIHIDWNQLHTLKIFCSIAEGWELLDMTSQTLINANLTLRPRLGSDSPELPTEPLQLSNLTTLALSIPCSGQWNTDAAHLFENLALLNLRSLTLNSIPFRQEIIEVFVEMLRRSQCELDELLIMKWSPCSIAEFEILMAELGKTPLHHLYIDLDKEHASSSGYYHRHQMIFTNKICSILNPDIGEAWESFPSLSSFYYRGMVGFSPRKLRRAITARFLRSDTNPEESVDYDDAECSDYDLRRGETDEDEFTELESFEVIYKNDDWFKSKHPNKVRALHLEFARLAEAHNATVHLGFEGWKWDDSDSAEELQGSVYW